MDKHSLRRQILSAVMESEPAAVTAEDIAGFPPIELATSVTAEILERELRGLAERGYLENLRPTREPLYRMTPAGRGQMTLDDEREEFVWGRYAL